jgi:hypothetical protein
MRRLKMLWHIIQVTGFTRFASFFLEPITPAIPPAIAMRTSQMVGEVRAINSLLA